MPDFICSLKLIALAGVAAAGLFACSRPPAEAVPTLAPTALLPPAVITTLAPSINTAAPPTATPVPSPTPCGYVAQPGLTAAWKPDELGCPITPGAAAVNTAYAPFEGGHMLWRGDTDTIYILFNDGRWTAFPNEWREGDPEYTCGEASNPPTPVRGFGRVWCDHPEVGESLGVVTAAEIGDNASAAQDYVNGTILAAPFGDLFVFVGEDGVWRRVDE